MGGLHKQGRSLDNRLRRGKQRPEGQRTSRQVAVPSTATPHPTSRSSLMAAPALGGFPPTPGILAHGRWRMEQPSTAHSWSSADHEVGRHAASGVSYVVVGNELVILCHAGPPSSHMSRITWTISLDSK